MTRSFDHVRVAGPTFFRHMSSPRRGTVPESSRPPNSTKTCQHRTLSPCQRRCLATRHDCSVVQVDSKMAVEFVACLEALVATQTGVPTALVEPLDETSLCDALVV